MRRWLWGLWLAPMSFKGAAVYWVALAWLFGEFGVVDNTLETHWDAVRFGMLGFTVISGIALSLGLLRLSWWWVGYSMAMSAAWMVGATFTPGSIAIKVSLAAVAAIPGVLTIIGIIGRRRDFTWNPLGRTFEPQVTAADAFS